MHSLLVRLVCAGLVLTTGACHSLEFQNVRIVDQGPDEETRSYRVQLQFELLDGDGLPVQPDDRPAFWVYEDGVPCTSESIRMVEQQRVYRNVVLVLDTSASMGDSLPELRDAALRFSAKLRRQGFASPRVYRFARTFQAVDDVQTIEAAYLEKPDERWTSLYYSLREIIQEQPDSVFVVFSDGADNYSQNFEVSGVDEVVDLIEARSLQVHAIGCGDVKKEQDRNGVNGARALRRMARNGTYQYVEGVESLDKVFEYIADRLQSIVSLEYYSPNLSGEHELVVRAKRGRQRGESEPLTFRASFQSAP